MLKQLLVKYWKYKKNKSKGKTRFQYPKFGLIYEPFTCWWKHKIKYVTQILEHELKTIKIFLSLKTVNVNISFNFLTLIIAHTVSSHLYRRMFHYMEAIERILNTHSILFVSILEMLLKCVNIERDDKNYSFSVGMLNVEKYKYLVVSNKKINIL